jgi:hypothetical protein
MVRYDTLRGELTAFAIARCQVDFAGDWTGGVGSTSSIGRPQPPLRCGAVALCCVSDFTRRTCGAALPANTHQSQPQEPEGWRRRLDLGLHDIRRPSTCRRPCRSNCQAKALDCNIQTQRPVKDPLVEQTGAERFVSETWVTPLLLPLCPTQRTADDASHICLNSAAFSSPSFQSMVFYRTMA